MIEPNEEHFYFNKLIVTVRSCKCGDITIVRNDHLTSYETIREHLEFERDRCKEGVDENLIIACEETGEVWRIQIYPDSPVGFHITYGNTLEIACEKMLEILLK